MKKQEVMKMAGNKYSELKEFMGIEKDLTDQYVERREGGVSPETALIALCKGNVVLMYKDAEMSAEETPKLKAVLMYCAKTGGNMVGQFMKDASEVPTKDAATLIEKADELYEAAETENAGVPDTEKIVPERENYKHEISPDLMRYCAGIGDLFGHRPKVYSGQNS